MTAIRIVKRKPVQAFACRYDGTVGNSNYLMGWVAKTGNRQKLEPEGEDGRLLLVSPDGTYDLFEGWWLVYDENKFQVLTNDEFNEKYEMKE